MIARKRAGQQRKKKAKAAWSDEDQDSPTTRWFGDKADGGDHSEEASRVPKKHKSSKHKKEKKRSKDKKQKSGGSNMLSFGEEAEEVAAVVVKKRPSNPATRGKRVQAQPLRVPDATADGGGGSSAGMYSAEALQALKSSSFEYGGGHVPVADQETVAAMDAEADDMMGDDFVPPPDEDPPGSLDGEEPGDSSSAIGGAIPDSDAIKAAKQKRERLRKQKDYIPLNDSDKDDDDAEEDDDDLGLDEAEELMGDSNDGGSRLGMQRQSSSVHRRAEMEAALRDGADFYGGDAEVRHPQPLISDPLAHQRINFCSPCTTENTLCVCSQLREVEAEHVRNATQAGVGGLLRGRSGLDMRDTTTNSMVLKRNGKLSVCLCIFVLLLLRLLL